MECRHLRGIALALSLALGCGSLDRADAASVPARAAGEIPEAQGGLEQAGVPPEPTGGITLAEALSLALTRNPGLASFSLEVRAADAQTLQAGLRPNPELSVEAENLLGTGGRSGFDGAETTLRIGQRVELAGKRPKRARVASLERDLAAWDYEARKADVLAETVKSFVEVLEGQERVVLTEELLRLAERISDVVSQRVEAGKVSPVEETRAGVVLANSRIEVEGARRALEAARKRLALAWGSRAPAFERAVGRLEPVGRVPPDEEPAGGLSGNPDVARWETELERRRAGVELQQANRIPDITLEGGLRDLRETGDRAFIVAGSIPVPLFNRNQGEILAARHRLAKARAGRAWAEANVRAAVAEAYRSLSTAAAEVEALRTVVIPGAQSAFEAAGEGYRQGKFGFLDVLDAQRTLFEARGRYITALAACHKALVDLQRATAGLPGMTGHIPEQE